jgi:hypothetical protein
MASACTTVTVTPQSVAPPKQQYRAVVVGLLEPKSPDLGYLNSYFREGLLRRLHELNAFETIAEAPSAASAPDTLSVFGTVTEAEKGDEVLRLLVGMGAGREHVTAELELKDSDGNVLGHLQIRKAYSGAAGFGGAPDFIDIQGLTKQVGEQAAQTLLDWSRRKRHIE